MKIDPTSQFVIGKECPSCSKNPNISHIHAYLHGGEAGEKNQPLMIFHSYTEATAYVEAMHYREKDELIIMPLAEANFPTEINKKGNKT